MNDVEGGAFTYWPDGPDEAPQQHARHMANTAMVGDNHGMFHQVGPVGPFDRTARRVTARAELAPAGDDSGDWSVRDRGTTVYRAPLERYRVSVLWKADVYRDEAEQRRKTADALTIPDVLRIFDRDLERRGSRLRLDPERLGDPGLAAEVSAIYPEAVPVGKAPSIFDAA